MEQVHQKQLNLYNHLTGGCKIFVKIVGLTQAGLLFLHSLGIQGVVWLYSTCSSGLGNTRHGYPDSNLTEGRTDYLAWLSRE
jgi:hypothetical protein